MREFFRDWRRKMGAATLALALGVMGLWVFRQTRSSILSPIYSIGVGRVDYKLSLGKDSITAGWSPIVPNLVGVVAIRWVVIVGYWTVVIPLTLLSAYLLLSKPRPKQK